MISEYPLDVIIVIAVLSELNHYLIINRASRSLAKTGFWVLAAYNHHTLGVGRRTSY